MPTSLAATLLVSLLSAAGDEIALFRDSAIDILFAKGLAHTDAGSFVCVDIDGNAPDPVLLPRLSASTERELGPPSACECKDAEPAYVCNRVGSSQPACSVSISNLQFHAFTNATGQFIASCGWPRGGGEVVRFEKRDGRWQDVGTSGSIVL
jgi:hypothetical protein